LIRISSQIECDGGFGHLKGKNKNVAFDLFPSTLKLHHWVSQVNLWSNMDYEISGWPQANIFKNKVVFLIS